MGKFAFKDIYITEYIKDGKIWAGPRIKANNWDEAEKYAKILEVTLLGKLMYEFETYEFN